MEHKKTTVVISQNLKKQSDFINSNGDKIDPVTKEILQKNADKE